MQCVHPPRRGVGANRYAGCLAAAYYSQKDIGSQPPGTARPLSALRSRKRSSPATRTRTCSSPTPCIFIAPRNLSTTRTSSTHSNLSTHASIPILTSTSFLSSCFILFIHPGALRAPRLLRLFYLPMTHSFGLTLSLTNVSLSMKASSLFLMWILSCIAILSRG